MNTTETSNDGWANNARARRLANWLPSGTSDRAKSKSGRPVTSAQGTTSVIGWVDGLYRNSVRGWAMDMTRPAIRVTVELVDQSDEVLGRALADRYRADVHKLGYGDGYCGFAIPAQWIASLPSPRFFCTRPRVQLKGMVSASSEIKARLFEEADLILRVDHQPVAHCVTGWALNRNRPDERRQLRLRAGSRTIAMQTATLFRPDSMLHGADGFHGFYLPSPAEPSDLFVDDVISGIEFRIS